MRPAHNQGVAQLPLGSADKLRMAFAGTGDRQPATDNSNFRKGDDIARRLLDFAVESLRLATLLPKSFVGRHVAAQWIRSATSTGANYEEARGAESRADFIHKLGVATKESREACYWVELVCASGLLSPPPQDLLAEGKELARILGASAKTARQRPQLP